MQYLGDISPGDTIDLKFTTADADGVPTALTSGAISVYKDNSTTQSTSGVTLTASFDSITGLNNVRITTASDGTFYSAGSNFQVVITTGTVDGTSVVGYVVASFSIRARAAYAEIVSRIGTNGAGLTAIPWNAAWDAEVQSECTDALNAYDPPTNAELTARTLASESYATAAALATVDGIVDDILVDTGTTLPGTLSTIEGKIDTVDDVVDAILTDTGTTIPAQIGNLNDLSPSDIESAVFDHVAEGSYTFKQLIRGMVAALLGKASGLDTTTAVFRNTDDDVDVITATVDENGNRSAVTLDLTDTA